MPRRNIKLRRDGDPRVEWVPSRGIQEDFSAKAMLTQTSIKWEAWRPWRQNFVYLFLFWRFFFFFCMEVPRLGVKSELQLSAYATATAMLDLSPIWDLCHRSGQCRILNPPRGVRDWTCILMDIMFRFLAHWATTGTPYFSFEGRTEKTFSMSWIRYIRETEEARCLE